MSITKHSIGLFISLSILCGFFASESKAQNKPIGCAITPALSPDFIPKERMQTSNNLRRKPGAAVQAEGTLIYIKAKLVDRFCVPIAGAKIQLWQRDAAGFYKAVYDERGRKEDETSGYDRNFAYSGSTYSDNIGTFNFITIFPGSDSSKAPNLNLRISHPEFEDLVTRMYFAHHPKNTKDENLLSLDPSGRNLLIAYGAPVDPRGNFEGRVYEFTVVLDGVNGYRGF